MGSFYSPRLARISGSLFMTIILLAPFTIIAECWGWVTGSVSNLLFVGGGLIVFVVFLALVSIGTFAMEEELWDSTYFTDRVGTIERPVMMLFLVILPLLEAGIVYAYILPMDEKGCYKIDKLFSFNAEKIPNMDISKQI